MNKTCTKCLEEKPATLEFFHAYKRSSDGVRSMCKICRAKDNADNKEERTVKKRAHYAKHTERLLAEHREYYERTKEQQRTQARKRYHENRDKNITRMRSYREKNIKALNERRRPKARARFKRLYGNDLSFTLHHRTLSLVNRSLRAGKDGRKIEAVLGYTMGELKRHIEGLFYEGMNWEKYLSGDIHLDHKIPVAFFQPKSVDDQAFKECWALSNLQPLWAFDNYSKGSKLL